VKRFGPTRALDGLDLEVRTGEVHGFLGPDGAGKTTTLRVLLGRLRGGAGTARLLGGDPWRDATQLHRRLAYVPGDVTLRPSLSEVEALCDWVSIIRAGRIVESGTLAELRHLTRTSITAELANPPDGLVELAGVHDLVVDGTRVRFQVDSAREGGRP
jgi:ABC-type multidrug transport system ATPase subunit